MSSVPHASRMPSLPSRSGMDGGTWVLAMLCVALIGFAFHDTLRAMTQVWGTENYQHGYVIVPMALWLAWQGREELRRQPVLPCWTSIIPLAGACALWALGRLAGVNAAEQLAVVVMLPGLLGLVFGWRVVWALAFPLAFLLFAVPFGESFYPVMMERTADFTVAAVRLSGVPVIRDGFHFELPSGRWSVVEACSGLRYLLAALPLAAVYAAISWRSWVIRTLFIGMTAIVAIVANWLRAYLIVMLGHLSGMRLAVGVDHLIYGWVFFGFVMALVFWIGSLWREAPQAPAPDGDGQAAPRPLTASAAPAQMLAFVVAAAVVAATVLGSTRLQDQGSATIDLKAFEAAIIPAGASPAPGEYRPVYSGGVAHVNGRSLDDPAVGILIAQFVRQHRQGEMITYQNGVTPGRVDAGQSWRVSAGSEVLPQARGSDFPAGAVNEYRIAGPSGAFVVWEWFWVNGRTLTDPKRVKIHTALDLLLGRGDESIAWVVWTPVDKSLDASRGRLAAATNRLRVHATAAGLR